MLRILIKEAPKAAIRCLTGIILLVAASCSKYTDDPGETDPRLSRKYCNDPEAVNYNRDFPGTAHGQARAPTDPSKPAGVAGPGAIDSGTRGIICA